MYIIFQACLTLYNVYHGVCVSPPGLSHTPRSLKSEISFSLSDPSSYKKYTDSVDSFLAQYDEPRQADQMKFEDCGGEYGCVVLVVRGPGGPWSWWSVVLVVLL